GPTADTRRPLFPSSRSVMVVSFPFEVGNISWSPCLTGCYSSSARLLRGVDRLRQAADEEFRELLLWIRQPTCRALCARLRRKDPAKLCARMGGPSRCNGGGRKTVEVASVLPAWLESSQQDGS